MKTYSFFCAILACVLFGVSGCASPQKEAFNLKWREAKSLVVSYSINENTGVQLYDGATFSKQELEVARRAFENCMRPVIEPVLKEMVAERYKQLGAEKIVFLKGIASAPLTSDVGWIGLQNVSVGMLAFGSSGRAKRYIVTIEANRSKVIAGLRDPWDMKVNPLRHPRFKSESEGVLGMAEIGDCRAHQEKLRQGMRQLFLSL